MQKYNVIKNLLIASFVVGQKRKSGLFKLKIQKRIKLLADCLLQEPYSILQLLNRILLLHPIVFCFFLFFSFFCFFFFFFSNFEHEIKINETKNSKNSKLTAIAFHLGFWIYGCSCQNIWNVRKCSSKTSGNIFE